MKTGLLGSLIGAIMLVAVCAGPVLAGRRAPPLKVNSKPRMASSETRPTEPAGADDDSKYVEGSFDTHGSGGRVWYGPPADPDPPVVDVPAACTQAVAHGLKTAPSPRRHAPAPVPLTQEPAAPQEPHMEDHPPASYAAWELPDDAGIPNLELPADVRALDRPINIPVPEPFPETNAVPFTLGWDADVAQLRDRVADLEQDRQLRQLTERVREVETAEYGVDVTDEPWQHSWGGRIQADTVYWSDDAEFGGRPNYVEFRRLRIFCSGEGYGVWNYKLEFDLAPEAQGDAIVANNRVNLDNFGLEVKDAYLGIMDIPVLGYVRAGHFKVPFGLEELTSSKYTTFMERNAPHRFAPGREFGIAAYRFFPGSNMTFTYGVFYDEMSETAHSIVDDNQGYRAGLRFTWAPWYDECTGGRDLLHIGMAYLYTYDADREVRFTSRSEIHRGSPLVDTGVLVANQLQQVGTELAWVRGPLSLQGEYVSTQVNDAAAGTTNLWGAYALASCFLTGEHRPYDREEGVFGRVTPFENFWFVDTPCGCANGWGAWELAARHSYLDFRDIGQQQLHNLTGGLNWYWNPNSRLMFNWIHPMRLDDMNGLAQGDVIGMRFEVDF